MSCGSCNTINCRCANSMNAAWNRNQVANAAYYANQGMMQSNQVASQWQGVTGILGPTNDAEYQMFKKYASLTDEETIDLFLTEQKDIDKQIAAHVEHLQKQGEAAKEKLSKEFYEWCSKYKKQLTKERLEKLKVFL